MMIKVLYRYDFKPWLEDSIQFVCGEFLVDRKTPKGCWIKLDSWSGEEKFILDGGKKRFAYPTKELAWHGFLRRKQMESRILSSRLNRVQAAISYVKANPDTPDFSSIIYNYEEKTELQSMSLEVAE